MEADADRRQLLPLLDGGARGLFMEYSPAYIIKIAETDPHDASEYVTIAFHSLAAKDWKAATECISFWNCDKRKSGA
jgi:hypothetical protein